jgi:hypothetical protein
MKKHIKFIAPNFIELAAFTLVPLVVCLVPFFSGMGRGKPDSILWIGKFYPLSNSVLKNGLVPTRRNYYTNSRNFTVFVKNYIFQRQERFICKIK